MRLNPMGFDNRLPDSTTRRHHTDRTFCRRLDSNRSFTIHALFSFRFCSFDIYIYPHPRHHRVHSCSLFSVFQTPTHHQSSVKDQQIEIREKGVGTFGCQVYTGVSGSKARLTCLSCSFFCVVAFLGSFWLHISFVIFFLLLPNQSSLLFVTFVTCLTHGVFVSLMSLFVLFASLILLFPLLLAIVVCRIGSSQCFLPEKGRDTTHLILTRHS